MTMTRKFGLAALIGAATCSGALAADLPLRTAPPTFVAPLLSGWEGPYVGSTYGYGFTNFRTSQGTSRRRDFDGQSGGALAGYNFQTGHFVYGVEAGIDLNVIRGTIPGQVGLNPSRVDTLDDIRFRGRLGYEFGWFMPFVAGGGTINETYQSIPGGIHDFGDVNRTFGWNVGGGVDFKLNPHAILSFLPESLFGPLILRAEYIHDSLPRETYNIAAGGGFPAQQFRTKSDTDLVRLAIIYRFGDVAPRPYADALGNVNWGGGYGGILGGYGSADLRNRGFARTSTHGDGPIGGIYAGTNFMFFNSKVMLGFDGSTSWSDLTGRGTDPTTGDRTSFREYINADIRGRAGYAFGNFLPFVAAGVVFTRSEQQDRVTGSEQGRVPVDSLTIGAGLDYRITQRVSLRGEYLYETSINNKRLTLNGVSVRQDRDANVVRFGAAYHFE